MDVSGILDRLGVDVVKERGGEISCRCPFHDDRRPSFSVNADSGAWVCYSGCGGGGITELIRRIRGSQTEAKELIRLVESGAAARPKSVKRVIAKVLEQAIPAEPKKPLRIPDYDRGHVPPWEKRRGFSSETNERYRLGFSPFYNALVIPVPDAHALIYRMHPKEDWRGRAKYKYTRDFKAHSVLYTLFDFEIKDDIIILVEGPLDCLWLRQNGFKNVLSILGGGTVGVEQRKIIAGIDPTRIILAFDNDEGGQKTTEKALLWLKRYNCHVVDWKRFGITFDGDGNQVTVKDVSELDFAALLLMFADPPLVQAASIPKVRKIHEKSPESA